MSMLRSAIGGGLALLLGLACAGEGPGSGAARSAVTLRPLPAEAPQRAAPPSSHEVMDSVLGVYADASGPSAADWTEDPRPAPRVPAPGFGQVAVITVPSVRLFAGPGDLRVVGYSGLGQQLPAREASGPGCEAGQWYAVSGGAFLCSSAGAQLLPPPPLRSPLLDAPLSGRLPHLGRATPYRYGKARRGAFLFARPPTDAERATAPFPQALKAQRLDGAYLLALADPPDSPQRYVETRLGHFIATEDLSAFPPSEMNGELAQPGEPLTLPLAFTVREAPLRCWSAQGRRIACGSATRHARFPAGPIVVEDDGGEWMRLGAVEVVEIPRDAVRVAERIDRPRGVGATERWIHIDLSEQTLVAYEGDAPVFATLVSTGKVDHETPTGLFRVTRKYLSKVMNGHDDDDDEDYLVEEVPWTMYFRGEYAVHGAYWHDGFGDPRSHGCVNVSPADARWLFFWSDPALPEGWTGMTSEAGMHVYITGETPLEDEEDVQLSSDAERAQSHGRS